MIVNGISTVVGSIHRHLNERLLRRLTASNRGRGFLLSFMADAELSDEAHVFDSLLDRVDDTRLHQMVKIHRDDEDRHAAMLQEAAVRNGAWTETIPDDLRVVLRIDRHAGGFAQAFAAGTAGVSEAYALLQVIEERAVREYPAIVRALRTYDPVSADVVAQVVRDEARHVKYAVAIGRAYACDDATYERTLALFRAAEARAFEEHGRAMLRHVLENDLLDVLWPEKLIWTAFAGDRRAAA